MIRASTCTSTLNDVDDCVALPGGGVGPTLGRRQKKDPMDTFYKPSYRYSYGIHTVPVMRCFLIANCYINVVGV